MAKGRPKAGTSEWVDSNTAAKELGITPRRLRQLRKDGLLRLGRHYRIVSKPSASRPAYRWHVDRCAAALETPQEERE
ncbi:MAG: DNA-binding protein [Microcoleus sp. SIO2G3]|nr:DNA-binding protein [Microcoleus sp. SIO2G3]